MTFVRGFLDDPVSSRGLDALLSAGRWRAHADAVWRRSDQVKPPRAGRLDKRRSAVKQPEVAPELSESPYASFDNDPGEVTRQLRQPFEGPLGFMAVESGEADGIQRFDDPRPRRFFLLAGAGPPDQVRPVVAPTDPDTSDTKLVAVRTHNSNKRPPAAVMLPVSR